MDGVGRDRTQLYIWFSIRKTCLRQQQLATNRGNTKACPVKLLVYRGLKATGTPFRCTRMVIVGEKSPLHSKSPNSKLAQKPPRFQFCKFLIFKSQGNWSWTAHKHLRLLKNPRKVGTIPNNHDFSARLGLIFGCSISFLDYLIHSRVISSSL